MAKRALVIDDLLQLVGVADPTFRPGCDEILFTKSWHEAKFKKRAHLWSVGFDGAVKAWTQGDSRNWSGRWAPDGSGIAFLSSRGDGGPQLYFLSADGGEARPITTLPEGSFADFKWSPDAKRIVFAFRETHPDFTAAGVKARADEGRAAAPKISESAYWRLDGDGFFMEQRHELYLVDVASGATQKLYSGCPIARYTFDWAPDGTRIALTRSFADRPWIDPVQDEIVLVTLDGASSVVPGLPAGEKADVRWSPDGARLAYIGSDDPNDHRTVENLSIFVCSVDGGGAKALARDLDIDWTTSTLSDSSEPPPPLLQWRADSKALYAQYASRGEAQFVEIDAQTGALLRKTEGHHVLGVNQARDGQAACLMSAPTTPPEVALADLSGEVRRLTAFNKDLTEKVHFWSPTEFEIDTPDGHRLHAWKLIPNPETDERKAAILEIHGGPQCQYGWNFFFEFQLLAAQGYAVIYTNPRGSKGYGAASTRAIAGRWGDKDWVDIEAAKNWMKAQPNLDPARLGVMGGSYGGYMVNWVIGHTTDFRAAITDRCVSNLISKSLNTDYPYHPGTYWKGAAYEGFDGIQELWRDSPIAYFQNVTTPTMIIHSEGDLRCHIEQGEQVFTALQELGVPCRFVRYPSSTSHGMSRGGPADLRMHRLNEIVEWWKRWFS